MDYYFSGATNLDIKRELNVNHLFAQHSERKAIRETIEYKKAHPEFTGKIMVDSGAFSMFTQGLKIDTQSYLDFIDEIGDDVDAFVSIDHLTDPKNIDFSLAQKTWDNYLYMRERIRPELRDKFIIVFHYGEDFKWLKNMLEYRDEDGKQIKYIGLGIAIANNVKTRLDWLSKCNAIIAESSNPDVKTHAFGVGVKSVLDHIPVTSTDATSWIRVAAFGGILVDNVSVPISTVREETDLKAFSGYPESKKKYILDKITQRGFTLEELQESTDARAKFNIMDTIEWVSAINARSMKNVATKVDLW